MVDHNASPAGSRKIWILGGLLAVVAVAGYFSLNYPPAGEDAAGTIVPAKRYRADDAGGGARRRARSAGNQSGVTSPGATGEVAGAVAPRQADASDPRQPTAAEASEAIRGKADAATLRKAESADSVVRRTAASGGKAEADSVRQGRIA